MIIKTDGKMLVIVRNVSQHKSHIRIKQSSFLETQEFSGIYILILVFFVC